MDISILLFLDFLISLVYFISSWQKFEWYNLRFAIEGQDVLLVKREGLLIKGRGRIYERDRSNNESSSWNDRYNGTV
jgi:hypothetical protein